MYNFFFFFYAFRVDFEVLIAQEKLITIFESFIYIENSGYLNYFKFSETIFVWKPNSSIIDKLWFLFTWPVKFILFITIPDCRYKCLRKLYPLTFCMCVAWIAISSYLASWMTTIVGYTIGIPDSVMGLTFLSAGGNLPEMVSIVLLARQG